MGTVVGSGRTTPVKHYRLEGTLDILLTSMKRYVQDSDATIWYVDANAGSGHYAYRDGTVAEGSPLIALRALLDGPTWRWRLILVEREQEHCEALAAALSEVLPGWRGWGVELFQEDNRVLLPTVLQSVKPKDRGIIFFDPNGELDLSLPRRLATYPNLRGVDFLLNVNASILKLVRAAAQSDRYGHTAGWSAKDARRVSERIREIRKEKAFLTAPLPGDQHQWSLILLTNWKQFPRWKNGGFYDMDTDEGQEVLRTLSYSKDELKER